MITHGMRRKPVYAVWRAMRARCENPNDPAFQDYGGRGITVCPEWRRFSRFYADMGSPPKGGCLERVFNHEGYSLANCVWTTRREQNLNKRNNVLVTLDGETHPLSVWAERYGLKYAIAHQRLTKYGWTPEAALKTPIVMKRKGVPRGQKIHAWGAENGIVFQEPQEAAA